MKNIMLVLLVIMPFACKKATPTGTNLIRIQTLDTDFSKGRLGLEHEISLEDVEKFHGHFCDGLVVGYQAMNEAMKVLYPGAQIDRTNTRIVSKSSPCLTDVAVYLTGRGFF